MRFHRKEADMSAAARKHTVQDTLSAAKRLAPTIARRAPEIERARRIPRDLLDELVAAGCFRVLTPTSHGGLGADLASGMKIFEALARADASVGWTVMIGSASWIDLLGLPRATFDNLFASAPNVIFAGVFNPSGSVRQSRAATMSRGDGASPVAVSTPTGCSATTSRASKMEYPTCAWRCSHPTRS